MEAVILRVSTWLVIGQFQLTVTALNSKGKRRLLSIFSKIIKGMAILFNVHLFLCMDRYFNKYKHVTM